MSRAPLPVVAGLVAVILVLTIASGKEALTAAAVVGAALGFLAHLRRERMRGG